MFGKDNNPVIQANPYSHTGAVEDQGGNPWEVKKQPTRCRDPLFAVLFIANVAAMVGVFIKYGNSPLAQDNQAENQDGEVELDEKGLIKTAVACAAASAVFSAVVMQILMCIPGFLIKFALFFNIGLAALACLFAFYSGSMIGGIISAVFLALFCCYAYMVWSRIPFATANLKTGCAALRANCGVTMFAYVFVLLAVGWSILWSLAVAGLQSSGNLIECTEQNGSTVCGAPNYGIFFLLFLSFFFTHEVLRNSTHVTVAGVVASWWFTPDQNGFCGAAVCGSFFRTLTTSLGSICFGSLLVALIQATRQVIEMMRQNDDFGDALACCIDCILGCIEGLLEYFNKWAFVYVGVYGYGYCEAGKSVMALFKDRGWEAIIADDLVGMALGMMSLVTGLVMAGVGCLLVKTTDYWDLFIATQGEDGENAAFILAGVIGFIIGLVICSVLMSTIASSVNTSIVLFADAPAEFERHYPELSREMREAYNEAHPGCI
jgi:hypothetical protein